MQALALRPTTQSVLLRLSGALLAAALVLTLSDRWINDAYQAQLQSGEAALIQSAQQVGEVIHQDLRARMIGNDRSRISLILMNANQLPERQRITVIGPTGHVYLDSQMQLQGATLTKDMPHCVECHQKPQPPTAARLTYDPGLIRVATPIKNDTRCSSCHVSSSPYLGVVLIDMSRSAAETAAQRTLWMGWALALVGAGLVGAASFWGLRLVHWPAFRWPRPAGRWPGLGVTGGWLLGGLMFAGLLAVGGGLYTAHLEGEDSFCAACHTQPEGAYFKRAQATAVDLASAHTAVHVACIDCHSGAGVLGRSAAILEGAGNAVKFITQQYRRPAVLAGWISDENCLKCHAAVLQAAGQHFHHYLLRWQQRQPAGAATCVSCHPAHALGGSADAKFLIAAETQVICERCHTQTTP